MEEIKALLADKTPVHTWVLIVLCIATIQNIIYHLS